MFLIYQDDFNTSPQLDYVKATAAESYVPGELLKLTNGAATKASGTDDPLYISNGVLSPAAEGDLLQVIRLHGNHKLKTTLSADGASLKAGDKVTISSDGLQATATTGGTLEIAEIMDTDVGGAIIVRVTEKEGA